MSCALDIGQRLPPLPFPQPRAHSVRSLSKNAEHSELIGFFAVAAMISLRHREKIPGGGAGLSIAGVGSGGGRHTGRLAQACKRAMQRMVGNVLRKRIALSLGGPVRRLCSTNGLGLLEIRLGHFRFPLRPLALHAHVDQVLTEPPDAARDSRK